MAPIEAATVHRPILLILRSMRGLDLVLRLVDQLITFTNVLADRRLAEPRRSWSGRALEKLTILYRGACLIAGAPLSSA